MADVLEKYSLKELLHIDFRSKIGREIKNKSQLSVKEIKKRTLRIKNGRMNTKGRMSLQN